MRFEILGPLRVINGSAPVSITASRERTLLAMLLLHANRPVPRTRLIEAIWEGHPPPGARNQLHGCVSRVRRRLAGAGASSGLIVTEPAGYRATIAPDKLDLLQFRAHIAQARQAAMARDQTRAVSYYRAGLALWHGPALAGIDNDPVRRAAATLDEEHAEALEERIDLELAADAGPLVAELTDLVGRHPHRERLHRALMLTLYRSGRQADALAAYRRAHRLLCDELGIEPGADLQRLHQAILNRDPALETPPRAPYLPSDAGGRAPVPRELPADVAGFTGRADALKTLDELLTAASESGPGTVVISAIAGTAGVGKTALAVRWAHQVADRFPNGQLYLNLRGYAPSGPPVEPGAAVRVFLDALGVPPSRIPTSPEAQFGLYRSVLAGRRVLVLLDNARDAEQVRPLLPGTPGCLVLVTSRDQLSGLLAADGARPLFLDLLSLAEARQLLSRRLGPQRVADEPEAVDEIVTRCARLPLALALVAARAATHPELPLATLADQLGSTQHGLDAFASPDPATDLRAVFSWSYRGLSLAAARLFRLLGLHPGPDTGVAAAASLAGVPPERVRPVLAELAQVHLVSEPTPSRYSFHDLLRAYAGELAEVHEPADQQCTAQHRLYDYYLHTAHTAAMLLYPLRDPITLPPPWPGVIPEQLAGHERALAWFAAEYPVLLGAIRQAARAGFNSHVWQLTWSLRTFFERRGHWYDMATTHRTALDAARRAADPTGLAQSYRGLAGAHLRLRQFDAAYTCLHRARDLFRELDDHVGRARVLLSIAHIDGRLGRLTEAIHHAEQSLDQFQAGGSEFGQASALNDIGWYYCSLGRHRDALDYCGRALELHERSGGGEGLAHTWDSLGYIHHHRGDYQEAVGCYRNALRLFRDLGDRYYEASTLTGLGDTYQAAGDPAAAGEVWDRALVILNQLGHPDADRVRARLDHPLSRNPAPPSRLQ